MSATLIKKGLRGFAPASLLILTLSLLVPGCGSSGGGSSDSVPTTAITGSLTAGPVAGALVTARNGAGTLVAGPATTGADGTYTLAVPDSALPNDLYVSSTGGTFTDEATGTVANAGTLSALVPGGTLSAGSGVHLTPATTLRGRLIKEKGRTTAQADADILAAFGFNPDHTIAPQFTPATGSDASRPLAGLRAAAFSQLTKDLALSPSQQFDLIAALTEDLSDGVLDGKNTGVAVTIAGGPALPEDIQNRFVNSLCGFMASSRNLTGIKADQLGVMPFGKVAFTDSYRIEYLPGAKPATEGKSPFTLKVDSRATGAPVGGLTPVLTPTMHMATMSHGAPMDAVSDNGDGTYSCTAYYLMASSMGGVSMGFWTLKVDLDPVGGEEAFFYPQVGMAMGGVTGKATLKGQADTIASMSTPKKRSWYLFPDGISGAAGNHTVKLFIAATESSSSYPAAVLGTTLHNALGDPFTVDSLGVEVSTDLASWAAANNEGGGHFSLAGVSGLAAGTASPVYARLTVNGEVKTTDGNPVAETNGYATLNVKPMQ